MVRYGSKRKYTKSDASIKRSLAYNEYKDNAIKFGQPVLPFIGTTTDKFISGIKKLKNNVYLPNNTIIPKNVVDKYTDIGYTIVNQRLTNPVNSTTYPTTDLSIMFNQIPVSGHAVLNRTNDESVNMEYSSLTDLRRQLKIIYEDVDSITIIHNSGFKHGPLRDGELNCVIDHCEQHAIINKIKNIDFQSLYNAYSFGAFQSDIQDIVNICKFPIVINGDKYDTTSHSKYKELKLEAFNNHVTMQCNTVAKTKYINIIDEYYDTQLGLERYMLDNIPLNKIKNIINPNGIITYISTKEINYCIKYYNDIDFEEEKVITPNQYYFNKSFNYYTIKPTPIKANNVNIDTMKEIRTRTINWSNDFEFSPLTHTIIDINSAFNNFGVLPTDLDYSYTTELMTKKEINDIINNYEGFALIEESIKFDDFEFGNWLSMPEIRFLQQNGFQFHILQFMISSNKTTFDIDSFMNLGKFSKRKWHNVLGRMMSINKITTSLSTDVIVGGRQIYKKDDTILYENFTSVERIGDKFYPHITGYVHGYTNIKMITKYLELKSLGLTVERMWVDGIYVKCKKSKLQNKISSNWKIEEKPARIVLSNEQSIHTTKLNTYSTKVNITKDLCTAYIGYAGCGKSYKLIEIYKQNPSDTIILAPTCMLKIKYQNMGFNCETIHQFVMDSKKSEIMNLQQYTTILIDEYTMCTQSQLDSVFKVAKELKHLYVFGDIGQLLNVVDGIAPSIDKFNIIELTDNYRQTDPVFRQHLKYTRETGNLDWIKQTISIEDAILSNKIILTALNDDINKINKIGYELNKNEERFGFKIDTPYVFKTNTKQYVNGTQAKITSIDEKFVYLGNIKVTHKLLNDDKKAIKSYARTFHRIQGETIADQDIVINTNGFFDNKRMAYVGASRPKEINQLYILI